MEQANIKTIKQAFTISSFAMLATQQRETELGILRNTSARFVQERRALLDADTAHEFAKIDLRNAREARYLLLDAHRSFARLARDVWRPQLGTQYSAKWSHPGFRGSLQIPIAPAAVILLLERMTGFLESCPTFEVPSLNVTAVKVKAMATALLAANNLVKNHDVIVKTLQAVRDQKFRVLRKRIRDLIKELAQILDPSDARWAEFGLKVPGAKKTPPAPENVVIKQISETSSSIQWDPTPRAEYYRVRARIAGVDEAPKWVGSPSDPDFILEEMPADKDVEITVYAVNRTGESVAAMVTRRAGIHQI